MHEKQLLNWRLDCLFIFLFSLYESPILLSELEYFSKWLKFVYGERLVIQSYDHSNTLMLLILKFPSADSITYAFYLLYSHILCNLIQNFFYLIPLCLFLTCLCLMPSGVHCECPILFSVFLISNMVILLPLPFSCRLLQVIMQ